MQTNSKIIIYSTILAILVNILLPLIVGQFATDDQKKPPTGDAGDLNMWDQIMHMLYHHKQVPVSSSIIIALISLITVSLGIFIADRL